MRHCLDIFSLGTIAYLLFTGKPPAENDLELQDKLSRGTGLQITDELNGAGQDLQDLIQYATHPDVGSRIGSVAEFIEYLHLVEDEITRPDTQRHNNPTEARPGDTFDGGVLVKKRLGRGASSVTFVVEHQGQERVLKLAADVERNKRLRSEGETLHKLRHQAIVAHHETQEFVGHTGLLIDLAAGGTLARRLREQGAIQLELLERFGDDLLGALCHLEEKGISHRDIKPENIGLMMQGRQLHLVLFDFSLSNISSDNFTAGTVAYMDPFIRDPGRRRWDDYAERFATALTLYEMATGTLPAWAAGEGMPPLIEGSLEFAGLSNHRLLRLAVAASQGAALSSRAEFYPRGMPAERSIELAQGALLGTRALFVDEVHSRIHGRYPEAQPLPGRPQLDNMMQQFDLGFEWDGNFERGGKRGAYCLPQSGLTSYASHTHTAFHNTQHEEGDVAATQEVSEFTKTVQNTIDSARFLALSVRPSHWQQAKEKLCEEFSFQMISFDELLLRHLHQFCDAMTHPPNWDVVLKADAATFSSVDWTRLQGLVRKVLPAMTAEVKAAGRPVLLTEPGLIARYELVNSWLSELRNHLMNTPQADALVLLIANDIATTAAVIDGATMPSGTGSKEFARIPNAWLLQTQGVALG